MALTIAQYNDLKAIIEAKKAKATEKYNKASPSAQKMMNSTYTNTIKWYDSLLGFLDPERKGNGADFTQNAKSALFIAAYTMDQDDGVFVDLPALIQRYQPAFRSGDVDKTYDAIQSMFGLKAAEKEEAEIPEEVDHVPEQIEEIPKEVDHVPGQVEEIPKEVKNPFRADRELYGFAATSDENRKIILDEMLGKSSKGLITQRPLDPTNREDVLRLFRRNNEGKYELAFPAAKDPGFQGLTEEEAVSVLTPENGFVYYKAGDNTRPLVYNGSGWSNWYTSKWNPRFGNSPSENDVPDFTDKENPLFSMSREALKEQGKRKELEVELMEEQRSEKVLDFLFGSRLDHTGSDAYRTYDEIWVSNIKSRAGRISGGTEYPEAYLAGLSEDDVVTWTMLNLANPDVTGTEVDGLWNVVKDKGRVTIGQLDMNLDTYLNRARTNTLPLFLDPIVKARGATYEALFESAWLGADDRRLRMAQMGESLAKGLPMLMATMTEPVSLSGRLVSRFSQARRVQELIDRHPEVLVEARKTAKALNTGDDFERSLRKCRTLSKLYTYGKKAMEDELRLSKHQAGLLCDSEGKKIELSEEEAETLRLEADKRNALQEIVRVYSVQVAASLREMGEKDDEEHIRFMRTGKSKYLEGTIPESKRGSVGRAITSGVGLEFHNKEVAPVLTLVLEHEGGMEAFEEFLRETKLPPDSKDVGKALTKALIDNGLIPPDNNGDPEFDYDRAIRRFGMRKQRETDRRVYGFATGSEESRKTILTQLLGKETDGVLSSRPFDPTNREDVLRLYRRNEDGRYEPAFPEAKDPKFKGLTEEQTLDVFDPKKGYLYFKAGSRKAEDAYVFNEENSLKEWAKSEWNLSHDMKAEPPFAEGVEPGKTVTEKELKAEAQRKDLDVMLKEQNRGVEVYRFLFGSRLDHVGSNTYQTYDEIWVSKIRERGGTEYPIPEGKALPEDDVVALTMLNMTDPEVTGREFDGIKDPMVDPRITVMANTEMTYDTYLNRRLTNTAPTFLDPIVKARAATSSTLTEFYGAGENAPGRYDRMADTLVRALPTLTSMTAFTNNLNGAAITRCGQIQIVQNLLERHPQLLKAAREKAKAQEETNPGTLGRFERSLRKCSLLSKMYGFEKSLAENELRCARHQAGQLYDAEGKKVSLSPDEEKQLQLEVAKRGIVAKMLVEARDQVVYESLEVPEGEPPTTLFSRTIDARASLLSEGTCEFFKVTVPTKDKREKCVQLLSEDWFTYLHAQDVEMPAMLTLLLDHRGGMTVFDDILAKAKDPTDYKEVRKALVDNKLIPEDGKGDVSFDCKAAIEDYYVRHPDLRPEYDTFVKGVYGAGKGPREHRQSFYGDGSYSGGFIVTDDIKTQLQSQPVSEFLHFENGKTPGEHYVTHRLPEMGRHAAGPDEDGFDTNYKLREYMNKATKFAFKFNFRENGDLKDFFEATYSFSSLPDSDIMEQCRIPKSEEAEFLAFLKDHRSTVEDLVSGVNMQFQKIAYYEALNEHLPQITDEKEAETVRSFLKDNLADYQAVKHKIAGVILRPEDSDTFLNFCSSEQTAGIMQRMADSVNRYRANKRLDPINMTQVKVDFPNRNEHGPASAQALSAVEVTLNGESRILTMESMEAPFGKLLYQPDKNPQALGLYRDEYEIENAYTFPDFYIDPYASDEKEPLLGELGSMKHRRNELGLDKPYNFASFSKGASPASGKTVESQKTLSTPADQQIERLQGFSDRIAASQKQIRGSSSKQFTDLQHKLDECLTYMKKQRAQDSTYLGTGEKETAQRLSELGKYVRAYLAIKQNDDGVKKSLNTNGQTRYAIASELKEYSDLFEPKKNLASVTPTSLPAGRKMTASFCTQIDAAEKALKGKPALEPAKYNDLTVAIIALQKLESADSKMKLSAEDRKKAVKRVFIRAQRFIDAERIAAEKSGKALSPESAARIELADNLRGFAMGYGELLSGFAMGHNDLPEANHSVSNEQKNPESAPFSIQY